MTKYCFFCGSETKENKSLCEGCIKAWAARIMEKLKSSTPEELKEEYLGKKETD